jgi:hypothetical protein
MTEGTAMVGDPTDPDGWRPRERSVPSMGSRGSVGPKG